MFDTLLPYFLLYMATLLEGELAALSGAFASRLGVMEVQYAFLAIFFGTLTIDWLSYFTGRLLGLKIYDYFPKLKAKSEKAKEWIHKNSHWNLVVYRFLYGLRIMTLLIFGINKVPLKKFLPITFGAIFLWSLIFTLLGFYLGEAINEIFNIESLNAYIH